jgi:hypothetical protein
MAKLEMEAHRLAADALRQQDKDLGDLRARTSTLLTAASLIATFLGGQALARVGLSVWIVLALAAFGLAITLCIYVLLPNDDLTFGIDAHRAYVALYEIREDEKAIDQRLAN